MTFHKAKEEYKWKQCKEQEEKILRESGAVSYTHLDRKLSEYFSNLPTLKKDPFPNQQVPTSLELKMDHFLMWED